MSTRKAPSEHANDFKIGYSMKGNDGNIWTIKKTANGIKRWVLTSKTKSLTSDDYHQILWNKNIKWWSKLSGGQFIVVYYNGKYKFVKSSMKTRTAQIKDITTKWHFYANKFCVKAIIWSPISTDALTDFISYVIRKNKKTKLNKLCKMSANNNLKYFLKDFSKYFTKYALETKKDYLLKR